MKVILDEWTNEDTFKEAFADLLDALSGLRKADSRFLDKTKSAEGSIQEDYFEWKKAAERYKAALDYAGDLLWKEKAKLFDV